MSTLSEMLKLRPEDSYDREQVITFVVIHVLAIVGVLFALIVYVYPAIVADAWPAAYRTYLATDVLGKAAVQAFELPYQLLLCLYVVGTFCVVGFISDHMVIVRYSMLSYFLCHLSITLYAHRFCAHEGFRTSPVVQFFLWLQFMAAKQGPASWWSTKHRVHHRYSDQPGLDVHTPLDGFMWAHCLWTLTKLGLARAPNEFFRHLSRRENGVKIYALTQWLDKYHKPVGFLMAFGFPTLVGWLLDDWVGGFLVGGCARLMFQYHFTWIVNSLGHSSDVAHPGARNVRNFFLAIMTTGESFHDNHHEFEGDCKLSRYWYEIDLGWYVLWTMSKVGLAWNLRRPSSKVAAAV